MRLELWGDDVCVWVGGSLVEQLAATIVGSCSFLWSLSEALAELDVVASFAEYALQTSACRMMLCAPLPL